jgi:hypothetical protein
MKRIAWAFLTLTAGVSAVSCGSREEAANPAAPAVPAAPAAAAPSAEPGADVGAQAVRTASQTWFFIDGCDDGRKVRWKLFDAADNFQTTFPAAGVWTIQSGGRSQKTITCKQGHPICFGAIQDLPAQYFPVQWGVGINGQRGPLKGACFKCNNQTIGGKLVCRFRKSLAPGVDAPGGDAMDGEVFLEEIE